MGQHPLRGASVRENGRQWLIQLMRERTLAVRAILANDAPEYHGKHVDFDPIWAFPKPIQQPHPPFLLGSSGYSREYNMLRRTGRHAL